MSQIISFRLTVKSEESPARRGMHTCDVVGRAVFAGWLALGGHGWAGIPLRTMESNVCLYEQAAKHSIPLLAAT